MGAKSDNFCLFSAFWCFSPDLWMEYRIFISANLENIDIDIDIAKAILKNIDKGILENIDIDKILNRLEFGIWNRATPWGKSWLHPASGFKET